MVRKDTQRSFYSCDVLAKRRICRIDKFIELSIGIKRELARQVTVEEAEKFAMDHGMMYFEHSCKTDSREALLAKLQEAADKYKMQSG